MAPSYEPNRRLWVTTSWATVSGPRDWDFGTRTPAAGGGAGSQATGGRGLAVAVVGAEELDLRPRHRGGERGVGLEGRGDDGLVVGADGVPAPDGELVVEPGRVLQHGGVLHSKRLRLGAGQRAVAAD